MTTFGFDSYDFLHSQNSKLENESLLWHLLNNDNNPILSNNLNKIISFSLPPPQVRIANEFSREKKHFAGILPTNNFRNIIVLLAIFSLHPCADYFPVKFPFYHLFTDKNTWLDCVFIFIFDFFSITFFALTLSLYLSLDLFPPFTHSLI